MNSHKDDLKSMIYAIIAVIVSLVFIITMIKVWNGTFAKTSQSIDESVSSIVMDVKEELESNKDIYNQTISSFDHSIISSAEKGLNKVKVESDETEYTNEEVDTDDVVLDSDEKLVSSKSIFNSNSESDTNSIESKVENKEGQNFFD